MIHQKITLFTHKIIMKANESRNCKRAQDRERKWSKEQHYFGG